MLKVGSLFSGIGGIDLGLERAGMRVVFQCEADEWRRAVLRSHWPDVPCYEDVRAVSGDGGGLLRSGESNANDRLREGMELALAAGWSPDLLCGGFPCQDLSVAGRRAGLIQGARSSLFFEFARVADALRPRWLLVENVPGLLSSNSGRDFAVVLSTLADLGYGVAWRVLDSRYFGVPQRRRRVFVVGHLGADGPAPFLPFLEGGGGHLEEGGEAGAGVAYTSALGTTRGGGHGLNAEKAAGGQLVTAFHHIQDPISSEDATQALGQEGMAVAAPLSHGSNPNSNAAGRRREDDENLVAFISENQRAEVLETSYARQLTGGGGKAGQGYPAARIGDAVRRLTPTECCRLQGFPDDWLGQPNQPPDSPRYAALGDAVTVNVAKWVGRRILEAETGCCAANERGNP